MITFEVCDVDRVLCPKDSTRVHEQRVEVVAYLTPRDVRQLRRFGFEFVRRDERSDAGASLVVRRCACGQETFATGQGMSRTTCCRRTPTGHNTNRP